MIRNIAALLLVIVWMLIIFLFSSSDGAKSSATSSAITDKILNVIVDERIDTKEYEELSSKVSFVIRKVAHFTEYFILGLLLMNMMFILGIKDNRIITSVIIVILYACSDELHQVLVDGRDGNFVDVLLDSGAGMIAIYLYHRMILMRYNYEESID